MVLSIRVHELLTQNSKNNLIQNDFKSLIPKNDIPDKKQVYHKNMLEISEKTIELKKSKKLFQKKEEIIIDKIEDESDDESTDEFDEEPEEIEDTLNIEDTDKEEEVEVDEGEEDEKVVDEEEEDEEKDEEDKKDKDSQEKDLMLDLIGIIEDKNKKSKKAEQEKSVELENDNKVKKIVVENSEGNNSEEQSGGNFKRIKLDQHYNFF